jgi:hypothetical protein
MGQPDMGFLLLAGFRKYYPQITQIFADFMNKRFTTEAQRRGGRI